MRRVAVAAALLPALLLAGAAAPRMVSGFAWEAAYPATDYIPLDLPLPEGMPSGEAVAKLAGVSAANGWAQILRADAMHLDGAAPEAILPVLENGLRANPSSARGWTLLAEIETASDPERAAKALALALRTAPLDYRIVFERARVGIALWQDMPPAEQELLFRQNRFLFSEQPMRQRYLNDILLLPGGPELIGRSFAAFPEELRALNRFVERRRRVWSRATP